MKVPLCAAWLGVALALAACMPVGRTAPPSAPPASAPTVPVPSPPPAPEPSPRVERVEPAGLPPGDPPPAVVGAPVRTFAEVRGLWVVRFTMTSEQLVRKMVADAEAAGINTLIVQVRGRGDAYYRSTIEPRAEGVVGPVEFDPLAVAIEEGHKRGMAVHAWLNTHLVWGSGAPPISPEHLVNAHPEWLAVPRSLARELHGVDPRSSRFAAALRQYAVDRPETIEGIYTSPSHPDVRARVREVWLDIARRYDLDGLHFDYIRFPSGEFDYSAGALERFRAWATPRVAPGRAAELERAAASNPLAWTSALPAEWDDFRRYQITSLVGEIYDEIKATRPELVISAAVVPDRDIAHDVRFQEWESWIEAGILDVAVPMAYTANTEQFRGHVRAARQIAGTRERIWAGIGAYLNTADGTLAKIDAARAEDAGGVVLFSYDWIAGGGMRDARDPFLRRLARERFGP